MSALNQGVENLAASMDELTIGNDLRRNIDQQFANLRNQIQQSVNGGETRPPRHRTRKIDPYDGKNQPLRSFLTAIDLQMEDEGIQGDESKVRYVGRYLKDRAWAWFEPIIRERNEKPRSGWSDRAERILTSYDEMKKAMKQVFGDIDERKVAAQRIQKLRQHRSVREYITEFQTISSNLEWHDEALADKFLEGLKPEIQGLLIYYPDQPRNLEELFERAQRIDREHWNQRERKFGTQTQTSHFARKNVARRDRDGDIQMVGAKVDLEKAKKQGLCYNCGQKGHVARQCRQAKETKPRESPIVARMVRLENIHRFQTIDRKSISDSVTEERKEDQGKLPAVLATLDDLQSDDSITDRTDQADELDLQDSKEEAWKQQRVERWCRNIKMVEDSFTKLPRSGPGLRGRRRQSLQQRARQFKKDLRYPGEQPDESNSLGAQGNRSVLRGSQTDLDTSLTAGEFTGWKQDHQDVQQFANVNPSLSPFRTSTETAHIGKPTERIIRQIEISGVDQVTTTQLSLTALVKGKETQAIVDSGANINYANKPWCVRMGIRIWYQGFGEIKAYNGHRIQVHIYEADIEFNILGQKQKQRFSVLSNTGKDDLVLGMPWLIRYDPQIDWANRSVSFRKEKGEPRLVSEGEPLDRQSQTLETQEKVALAVTRDTTEAEKKQVKHRRFKRKSTKGKTLKITQATKEDSSDIEYEARLAEVKGKLPPELQEFADVFCKQK